jgi:hypothetical protein
MPPQPWSEPSPPKFSARPRSEAVNSVTSAAGETCPAASSPFSYFSNSTELGFATSEANVAWLGVLPDAPLAAAFCMNLRQPATDNS